MPATLEFAKFFVWNAFMDVAKFHKGITNVPSDVIIDAPMPAMMRGTDMLQQASFSFLSIRGLVAPIAIF